MAAETCDWIARVRGDNMTEDGCGVWQGQVAAAQGGEVQVGTRRYKAVGDMEGAILHDYVQRGFSYMEMVWEAIEGRVVVEKLFD